MIVGKKKWLEIFLERTVVSCKFWATPSTSLKFSQIDFLTSIEIFMGFVEITFRAYYLSSWPLRPTKIIQRLKLHICLSKSEKRLTQLCPSPACVVFKGKFLQLLMADSCRSKNCFRILSSMFFGSLFEGPRSSVLLSCTGHLFSESVPIFKILEVKFFLTVLTGRFLFQFS